ncbi:hypothetical protein [Mixta sp. Marseille-Q2659]|nr:hypothetical protein [Mixta sp. Marseille-Q2659]
MAARFGEQSLQQQPELLRRMPDRYSTHKKSRINQCGFLPGGKT